MILALAKQQQQIILSSKTVAILCSLLALICVCQDFVWANNNNQQNTYIQRPDFNGRPQLMIAIYCADHVGNGGSPSALYHNQYLDIDSRKWRTDRDASAFCTQDKQVVLNYCRKVYPNHNVRNIVESSRPYKIDNWCKLGSTKRRCRTRLTVRPYRCLEGTFQSDALLVPEKCVFDHVHNKSICESPDSWNKTATENCNSKGMRTQSFAILQPCGLDAFAGVEFVCCPQPNSETKLTSNSDGGGNSFAQATNLLKDSKFDEKFNNIKVDEELSKKHRGQDENDDHGADGQDSEEEEDDDYDDDEDEYDDDGSSWNGAEKNAHSAAASTTSTTTTTTTTTTERPIDHYLSHFDLAHERDDFREAELAVEGDYRDKISHVMKEWSQLDARYEEMKKKDPQAAEEFKKKMSSQFQKTVEALEEEGTAQRHQLASMHAERAMSIINRKKKASMDCLTQALDRTPIRTRQVERCIVKLLKALEKDRTHTLRQYRNLLSLNTHEALREKKIILDHLMTLNRAANQSIAMLDRSPVLIEKLKNKIITFWHQLRKIPLEEPIVRESEIRAMEKYEEEVAQQKIERERLRLVEQEQQEAKPVKTEGDTQKAPAVELTSSSVGYNVNNNNNNLVVQEDKGNQNALPPNKQDEMPTTESTTTPTMPQHLPLQAASYVGQAAGLQATEQHETSGPTHYQVDSTGFSHLKADSSYHELSYSVKHEPLGSHFKFGYSTALASCVAMVVLAFFGVYKYYSKNTSRAYRRQGFAEVGHSSPEEKTVTNMQFSGYENPAYKFYEAEA